jgi:2TM domain
MSTTDSKEKQYMEREAYDMAYKRVKKIKGFYTHLTVYILVNLFIVYLNISNLEQNESYFQFKNFTTAFFWGIGLLAHGFSVFIPNVFLGKNWEERKIKDLMDRNSHQRQS